jgi:hypothetical protein
MLGCLPELPGYNGSILQMDDEERDRIVKDLDEASSGLDKVISENSELRALIDLIFESTLPYNEGNNTFNDAVVAKWVELGASK